MEKNFQKNDLELRVLFYLYWRRLIAIDTKGKIIYELIARKRLPGGKKKSLSAKIYICVFEIINANTNEFKTSCRLCNRKNTATGLLRDTALITKSNV